MMRIPSPEQVTAWREQYSGKRIRLLSMAADPHPVPSGTEGECWDVDDMGQLLMNWDNGSTLNVIPGVDSFEVI
jgi:hypothetical protein